MKAVQTRSPINLAYEYANLNNVIVSIWVDDSPNIDSTTTPDYQLNSQAINNFATVEISELIRSKNDYIFNPDFYTKRDTAKYVLVKAVLLNNTQTQLEVKYDFLRARDGYLRRADGESQKELPQIYKNVLPVDFRNWNNTSNTTINANRGDTFGDNDAYKVENTDKTNIFILKKSVDFLGVHTFGCFFKPVVGEIFEIACSDVDKIIFNVVTGNVVDVINDIRSFDIKKVNGFVFVNVSHDFKSTSFIRINSRDNKDRQLIVFNPSVMAGNLLNQNASDLVLQDNYTSFTTPNIQASIMFDRKKANLDYNLVGVKNIDGEFFTKGETFQSVNAKFNETTNLVYDKLDGEATTQKMTVNQLDECKYTPTKVSFINRFGVIQDLVFFKKRTDVINTNKESYKTNVLQQGNYYSHIGQNQTIRKESKRSLTLNSGFYPEEFNTVFEQLQNSLHYWIDDEPAVLEGSSFNVKTRVNDKLINYTFDFKYSNEEVNTI